MVFLFPLYLFPLMPDTIPQPVAKPPFQLFELLVNACQTEVVNPVGALLGILLSGKSNSLTDSGLLHRPDCVFCWFCFFYKTLQIHYWDQIDINNILIS
jgi:hypothetical protein